MGGVRNISRDKNLRKVTVEFKSCDKQILALEKSSNLKLKNRKCTLLESEEITAEYSINFETFSCLCPDFHVKHGSKHMMKVIKDHPHLLQKFLSKCNSIHTTLDLCFLESDITFDPEYLYGAPFIVTEAPDFDVEELKSIFCDFISPEVQENTSVFEDDCSESDVISHEKNKRPNKRTENKSTIDKMKDMINVLEGKHAKKPNFMMNQETLTKLSSMVDKNYEPVMKIDSRNTLSETQLKTSIATGKKRKRTPVKRKKRKDSPPSNKKAGRPKGHKKAVDNALRNVHVKRTLSIYHSSKRYAEILQECEEKAEFKCCKEKKLKKGD